MNPTLEFNAQKTVESLVPKVIATMASLTVSPHPGRTPQSKGDQVSGTLGIVGDTVMGAVYIHLPAPLACLIANAMFGNPADQAVSDSDMNDVVGELTNMIGGGFKSALCDADRPCAMSTPSIIRGAYAVEVPQELHAEVFPFTCQGHAFAVEVHTKFD